MEELDPSTITASIFTAVHRLRVDAVTIEVLDALARAGVPSILLKGPATVDLLYDHDDARPYADTDLLIAHESDEATAKVLTELGFRKIISGPERRKQRVPTWEESRTWERGEDYVDIHHTMIGMGAPPDRVWKTFFEGASSHDVGGATVLVPNVPARALHIVLHSVQHGPRMGSPSVDLERLVTTLSPGDWEQVRELAERLDAVEGLSQGLRLHPEGERIAEALGLPRPRSVIGVLSATSENLPVFAIEVLRQKPGFAAKADYVFTRFFPSRAELEDWSQSTQRGGTGLARTRVERMAWAARSTPPAVRDWVRAWRAVRSG